MRKLIAYCLILLVILSVIPINVSAEQFNSISVPVPIKVVDFSYSFDELSKQHEYFEVVDNAAKPILTVDYEMGQVLKLQKAVIKDRVYVETAFKDSTLTSTTNIIESENSEYSTIKISNPYAGVEHLVEYEPYEDVKTTYFADFPQPLWEEGITISYWINVPSFGGKTGINSNVLGFTSERFQINDSDYGKYLTTVKYDKDYAKYTEAEKELLGITLSGVDKDSDFYFELADAGVYSGKPLYDYKTIGRTYWLNPSFINGYLLMEDGSVEHCETVSNFTYDGKFYETYSVAPYLGSSEKDHKPENSVLRYGWTYSEMWLDATSSFYFDNDNGYTAVQMNPNHEVSYGTTMAMHENDKFCINSWKGATTLQEAYDSGYEYSDSPASKPDEWHYVTVVIQNDWIRFYLDGKEIDVKNEYSSLGTFGFAETIGGFEPFKSFNKGTGARYGYGTNNSNIYSCYYGKNISPTIMEWITLECVNLTIGGGNKAGEMYNMFADTDEIMIKNVAFYDVMLTDEQISYLATVPNIYGTEYKGAAGDLNIDKKISARDALLILKHVAKMEVLNEEIALYADVNGDDIADTGDALDVLKYTAGLTDEWSIDGVVDRKND